MSSHPLRVDFPAVHQETIALLEQISQFFNARNTAESRRYQEQIEHQRSLELRMTIVAPMKAGKSTIINALIGQELLPSHSAAMTTLPTEIMFAPQSAEPVLRLGASFIADCAALAGRIRQEIEQRGLDWAHNQAKQYPHLKPLLNSLREEFCLSGRIAGQGQVAEVLTKLNHIVRLAAVLTGQAAPVFSELPQIETPFAIAGLLPTQHQVVLVDTPGPNEAGTHHLQNLVDEQLERSSLVLIVLDFTQLKSEAAEEVKQNVQRMRGPESLHVLVNKVDQRDGNAMSSSEIRDFVAADLGISSPEQVFELSARQAFAASVFLRELREQPDAPLPEMDSAQALARQTLGLRWQEKLQRISREELAQEAEELWRQSGFPAFLERAMTKLIAESTHRCLRTALQTGQNCLREWRNP